MIQLLSMKTITYVLLFICVITGSGYMTAADDQTSGNKYLDQTMPERWDYSADFEQTLPSDDDWWKLFNDPLLDSLINEGTTNNYNIRIALQRIEMARLAVGQAASQYYPTISIDAGYTKARTAGAMSGKNIPSTNSSYFSLGADMSWEIDLFGKITQQVKGKKALLSVSKADYVGAMVSMAADIATYYMNLRTLQAELQVAHEHLLSQDKVVKIAEARHEAGLVSKLDVAQAKTVYYSTEAAIPELETSIRKNINAIAILLGVYPGELASRLTQTSPQPDYRQVIQTGIPMNLLRRRPDIVAAERQLAVYASQIGIAKKDFLPSLSLQGSVGVASHDFDNLFKKNSFEYSIAPTLSWTLFDGFDRKYALASAKAEMELGVETYNQTVMNAVQEVDNAMTAYLSALETIELDRKVLEQSHEAFNLAIEQYKEGLAAFTNVVDAQISWLNYANSLVSAQGNALTSLVELYQALGGAPIQ